MPNGKTHALVGASAGAAISLWALRDRDEEIQNLLSQLFLSGTLGSVAGRLPDILEPATSPNHRAFFHSFAFGFMISYVGVKAWKSLKEKYLGSDDATRILIILGLVGIVAFVLHLVMDGFTPKGLPLI